MNRIENLKRLAQQNGSVKTRTVMLRDEQNTSEEIPPEKSEIESETESLITNESGAKLGSLPLPEQNLEKRSLEMMNLPKPILKLKERSSVVRVDTGLSSMLDGKLEVDMSSETKDVEDQGQKLNFTALRNEMWLTMKGLREGTVQPHVADSISKVGAVIIASVKIESDLKKKIYGE